MVDLLFGRRLSFHSPLTRDDLAMRLEREIAAPRLFARGEPTRQFEGTLAEGRFRMVRQVRGRNSFRSVISGTMTPGSRGTRIDVRLQLHPAVMVICAFVLMFGVLVASIAIPEYLANGSSPGLAFVIALVGIFVVFAIASAVEARKATRMLAALFEAEPGAFA